MITGELKSKIDQIWNTATIKSDGIQLVFKNFRSIIFWGVLHLHFTTEPADKIFNIIGTINSGATA